MLRLGREGSEGMYSLPQLMATQQAEPRGLSGVNKRAGRNGHRLKPYGETNSP